MEDTKRLKIVSETLESSQIKWWIDHGTLLGITRDSELLTWDNDIDISIFIEDLDKTYQELKPLKKNLSAHLIKTKRNIKIIPFYKGKDIDISSYEKTTDDPPLYIKTLVEFPRKKRIRAREIRKFVWRTCRRVEALVQKIEIQNNKLNNNYFPEKSIDAMIHNITKVRESMGIYHQSKVPSHFFKKFATIVWEDIPLSVPNDPETYLHFRYGPDWRTPKSKWKWWRDDMSVKLKKKRR